MLEHLAMNIEEVRERISVASRKTGRHPEDVTLVAVSKTFPPEAIREAYRLGVSDFGENYVQEAIDKIDLLQLDACWHFIGHLQKNKVRQVVKRFQMIQSVDSADLLHRIDRIAGEEGRTPDVLIQVNIAGEEQKSGIDSPGTISLVKSAEDCHHVRVRGLMLIPPFYDNPEENRGNFASLRDLARTIDSKGFRNWESRFLSMGMTDDFEIAIEEGSNMVRIGRAIFGLRGRN